MADKNIETIADELFDAQLRYSAIQDEVETKIMEIMDVDLNVSFPFEDFIFDYYDNSFELLKCVAGFEPTDEQCEKFWDLGFLCCWFVYRDGSEKCFAKKI